VIFKKFQKINQKTNKSDIIKHFFYPICSKVIVVSPQTNNIYAWYLNNIIQHYYLCNVITNNVINIFERSRDAQPKRRRVLCAQMYREWRESTNITLFPDKSALHRHRGRRGVGTVSKYGVLIILFRELVASSPGVLRRDRERPSRPPGEAHAPVPAVHRGRGRLRGKWEEKRGGRAGGNGGRDRAVAS